MLCITVYVVHCHICCTLLYLMCITVYGVHHSMHGVHYYLVLLRIVAQSQQGSEIWGMHARMLKESIDHIN